MVKKISKILSRGKIIKPQVKVVTQRKESHIIIEGEDAKVFIQQREMQIRKVSEITIIEKHEISAKTKRLREGYKSVQKYCKKK